MLGIKTINEAINKSVFHGGVQHALDNLIKNGYSNVKALVTQDNGGVFLIEWESDNGNINTFVYMSYDDRGFHKTQSGDTTTVRAITRNEFLTLCYDNNDRINSLNETCFLLQEK